MDVKRLAMNAAKKSQSNDPYEIASQRNIQIIQCPLKTVWGYYARYKRIQCIILNEDLSDGIQRFVCAHELGHAVCHPKLNTQWLKKNTLVSTDRIEREASTFAVELLLTDEIIMESRDCSADTLSKITGIPLALIGLKKFNHK